MQELIAAIVLAATVHTSAVAQQPVEIEPQGFTLPISVEVFDLPTAPNGVNYRLYVRAPLRPPAAGERATSVYFLDGSQLFAPTALMTYNQELLNYMPPSYFIGIGYRDSEDGLAESDRTRDYTPTAFTPPQGHFLVDSPGEWQGSGGAGAFFDYVESTIIPFIERRYDVSQDRVLVGKSTSGLGATFALLNRPDLFNRYIIISPALWWDDFEMPREERWVMRAEAQTREAIYPRETRVYFAAGEGEHDFGLVTDVMVLYDALRRRRTNNLKVAIEVLPGESHQSVYPSAVMRGLIGLYSDRRPSNSPIRW